MPSTYSINLVPPDLSIMSGHLRMGSSNPRGVEINANSRFLTLGGEPWSPVMGEMHFSRYPRADWREELLKMKAGGINIIANYMFWIHHEEDEGRFYWSGNRDIRYFTELCAECGLYAYPRIGPWAHGEARNGGFPDWLVQRCANRTRQDDPDYLSCVHRWYEAIFAQLNGLLWKQGGPIVGIQLENELLNNAAHILTLKHMARDIGFDVPLYTMTGWGPAQVPQDEVIPVFGGYPDAFWDRHHDNWSRPSRKSYYFSALRDDNAIGMDLLKLTNIADLSYLSRYPYGTCETGGGMQVAYHRRPYMTADDIAALAMVKVGSGSNLLGYYMYHGGSHPIGAHSTMQESQATGYPNDLPIISYDFQAPLGEFGQVRESYGALRPLHLFLHDFGHLLSPLPLILPEHQPTGLDDRNTLRWSARSDGHSGFIFINNYQRIESLPEHRGVQFTLQLQDGTITIPAHTVNIPAGCYMIWPFHLHMNGVHINYATCQLICKVGDGENTTLLFFAHDDIAPTFDFGPGCEVQGVPATQNSDGSLHVTDITPGMDCMFNVSAPTGQSLKCLVLTQDQAHGIYKANLWGRDRIIYSPAGLRCDGDSLYVQSEYLADLWFSVYPAPLQVLEANGKSLIASLDGAFAGYTLTVNPRQVEMECTRIRSAAPARQVPIGPAGVAQAPDESDYERGETWQIHFPADALDNTHEVLLRTDYAGDSARAYIGAALVADDFYSGHSWDIGLRRFLPDVLSRGLILKLLPLRKDAPVYIAPEHMPDFRGRDEVLEVRSLRAVPVYEVVVTPA